jgi:hypothetical protein
MFLGVAALALALANSDPGCVPQINAFDPFEAYRGRPLELQVDTACMTLVTLNTARHLLPMPGIVGSDRNPK